MHITLKNNDRRLKVRKWRSHTINNVTIIDVHGPWNKDLRCHIHISQMLIVDRLMTGHYVDYVL